jgi:predicted RNase H-like HicB family nuclease
MTMQNQYTAVVKQEDGCWVGWIEEVPGVNCQEKTYEELKETLKVTLRESSQSGMWPSH